MNCTVNFLEFLQRNINFNEKNVNPYVDIVEKLKYFCKNLNKTQTIIQLLIDEMTMHE